MRYRCALAILALLLAVAPGCGTESDDDDAAADASGLADGATADGVTGDASSADDTADAAKAPPSELLTAPFLVIAHRGGRHLRPEHTLAAYSHARSLGPPASPDPVVLELDLRPSSDGAVLCMHDTDVDRTTNGSGPLHEMTLVQVKELDAGHDFSKDGGKTFPWRGKGLKVPTLDEVLDAFPDALYVMEIKRDDPPIIDKVLASLDKRGAIGRTVLSAFNDLDLQEIRSKRPDALTGMGIVEMVKFAGLQPDQLADYVPPALFAQPPMSAVSAAIVDKAHQFDIKVHPWTINKMADMKLLIGYGVDGIMTDDPAKLIAVRAGKEPPVKPPETPDVPKGLAHLGVALAPLDAKAGKSGDLVLLKGGPPPLGLFGGPDPEGAGVRPNMALRVAPGTEVRAPVAGKVVQLLEQSQYGDWELHLRPEGWPAGWLVIFDHVSDLKVAQDDVVTLDAPLGVATPWGPSWSLVELHVLYEPAANGNKKAQGVHYCPIDGLTGSAKTAVTAALDALFVERTKAPWRLPERSPAMVASGCMCHLVIDDSGSAGGSEKLVCVP